jgi:pimeloyl-ACP methyl ester carboxylesterase
MSDVLASGASSFAPAKQLPVTPVAQTYTVADPKFDPLPGARAIYGEDSGGAYQIEVPDSWNGDVVYFAHGFRANAPQLTVNAPPMREYLVRQGYAWAASSYSKNGYEPGAGARDTYALRDVFAQKVGTPNHQYLYGQSMGGHVVALSLERYPTAYDGALSECGVVAGNQILDYFISWGALAGYFSGTDLTTAATDARLLGDALGKQITPALGTAGKLTAQGKAFEDAVQNLTGGPRPFFDEGFAAQYGMNFLVLLDAAAHPAPANAAAQNATTAYRLDAPFGSSDALNRAIPRVSANPAYRDPAAYPEFAPESGKIQRPLLTIHGTGDLFVPISQEQSYRKIVDAAGAGNLLVQRAIRSAGHCNFSEQEREQAFNDLVSWVTQGKKPAGDDLLGDLRDIGRQFTTPLDPADPGTVTTPAP